MVCAVHLEHKGVFCNESLWHISHSLLGSRSLKNEFLLLYVTWSKNLIPGSPVAYSVWIAVDTKKLVFQCWIHRVRPDKNFSREKCLIQIFTIHWVILAPQLAPLHPARQPFLFLSLIQVTSPHSSLFQSDVSTHGTFFILVTSRYSGYSFIQAAELDLVLEVSKMLSIHFGNAQLSSLLSPTHIWP
jgi:hypothetical protein